MSCVEGSRTAHPAWGAAAPAHGRIVRAPPKGQFSWTQQRRQKENCAVHFFLALFWCAATHTTTQFKTKVDDLIYVSRASFKSVFSLELACKTVTLAFPRFVSSTSLMPFLQVKGNHWALQNLFSLRRKKVFTQNMFLHISNLNKGSLWKLILKSAIFLLPPDISEDLVCWKQRHVLQEYEGPASSSAGLWGGQGAKPSTYQFNTEETEGTQVFSSSCSNSYTAWKQWINLSYLIIL